MERMEQIPQPEHLPHKPERLPHKDAFSIYKENAAIQEQQIQEIGGLLKLLKDAKKEKEGRLLRVEEQMSKNKLLGESAPLEVLIEGSKQDIVKIDEKIEELKCVRNQLIESMGEQFDKHTATKKYLEEFEPKIEQ